MSTYSVTLDDTTYSVTTSASLSVGGYATQGVYSVTAYGATGDGATDDSAAIQSALDACDSAGGGDVYMPPGTYLISGSLQIGDNTHLRGAGMGATTISVDAASDFNEGILENENYTLGNSTGNSNITISKLTIDNNQETPNSGSACGIWFKNVTDSKISDVEIIDCYDESLRIYGLGTGESSNIQIERVISLKDSGWGSWNNEAAISITSYASDSTNSADDAVKVFDVAVRDCFVEGGTQGVMIFNAQRVTVEGCHFENCDHRAVNIGPTSFDTIVTGCTALDCGGTGIHAANRCERLTITGNTCRGTLRDPSTVGQEGQGIKVYWGCDDVTITGNTCSDNYSDGIAVEGLGNAGESFTVSGNTCIDNGRDGVRIYGGVLAGTGGTVADGGVVGNTCNGNTGSGVYVGTDNASYIVSNVLIAANTLKGNTRYGVEVNYGSNIKIEGNHPVSNTIGDYSIANTTNDPPMMLEAINGVAFYTSTTGSPNGGLSAGQGSLCMDITNATLYVNTDGSTAWSAV